MIPKDQIILRVSGKKIHVGDLAGSAKSPDWGNFSLAQLSPSLASIPFNAGMLSGSLQGLKESIEVVLAAHQLRPLASNSVVAGAVTIIFKMTQPFQVGGGIRNWSGCDSFSDGRQQDYFSGLRGADCEACRFFASEFPRFHQGLQSDFETLWPRILLAEESHRLAANHPVTK